VCGYNFLGVIILSGFLTKLIAFLSVGIAGLAFAGGPEETCANTVKSLHPVAPIIETDPSIVPIQVKSRFEEKSVLPQEVVILFYRGAPVDVQKALMERRLHPTVEMGIEDGHISAHHNSNTGVSAIVANCLTGHQFLAQLIDDEKSILGGTRYTSPTNRTNSTVFENLPGERIQDENFRIQFLPRD
jgi:hypothetical protein